MSSNETGPAGEVFDAALAAFTAVLSAHATRPHPADPADLAVVSDGRRIDRIAAMERLRAVLAAAQHTEMVGFGRSQVEGHLALVGVDGLDPAAVGRGVGDQIGLACRVSPFHGSRRLGVARTLAFDLPLTTGLLAEGRISEQVAETVVSETRHLDSARRRLVDTRIVKGGLAELPPRAAAALVKKCAYEIDPAGYVARGRTARADRRVGLRPAPDTMSVLTGLLPVEQGVACLAALRAHTDTVIGVGGDERTRDQIMADTLVQRLTGQTTATAVNVEVAIVIPVDSLVDPARNLIDPARNHTPGRSTPDSAPGTGTLGGPSDTEAPHGSAEVIGYGPIPAGIARDILTTTTGATWWRRLFTAPEGGPLIGCDPRKRQFDGVLAHLIRLRDHDRCRDPFCDAPVRHIDHIRPYRAGGPTSFANGRGVCARGNYVKEMPGWQVEVLEDGLGHRPHTVRTTTPTGHTYDSTAGPAP